MTLLTYQQFQELNDVSRRSYVRQVEDSLAGEFTIKNLGATGGELPSFEHVGSMIEFKLIPAGEFVFGLTPEEETAARAISDPPNLNISEMRPARKVTVGSFLISRTPLLTQDARHCMDVLTLDEAFLATARKNPYTPLSVQREVALSCANELGCRLPYEIEWEYACRARTKTLFLWGDNLPGQRLLSEWLDYRHLAPAKWRENPFGLQLLFAGEWCMDEWRASHDDSTEAVPGVHVVKGGGSLFWPWQTPDEQFVWCLPSMRMPSTDTGGGGCAFRLVRELPAATGGRG